MTKIKQATIENLPSILDTALKSLLRGDWLSFSVEAEDFTVTAKWDKGCDGVKITGYVKCRDRA